MWVNEDGEYCLYFYRRKIFSFYVTKSNKVMYVNNMNNQTGEFNSNCAIDELKNIFENEIIGYCNDNIDYYNRIIDYVPYHNSINKQN